MEQAETSKGVTAVQVESITQARGSLTREQVARYDVEGYLVLPHLLDERDMAPACAAMMAKVDMIADELYADGLIDDRREDAPFETRLALLFSALTDKARAVPLPLEAGGAILFNDRCIHMSTPNKAESVRWSVDLRYQPADQDPMPQHSVGFLARSRRYPERVATLEEWLAERPEREA